MIDTDELVSNLVEAGRDTEPRLAVRDVLEAAVHAPGSPSEPLGKPEGGWLEVLYRAPDFTVLNVVWPPLINLFPHDHRMWAAIAIYQGQEDNTLYRRQAGEIVASGGKEMRSGDVLLLGDDVIHSVVNPVRQYTGAIHVYGGDFIETPRSQWNAETLVEEPYDLRVVQHQFDAALRAFEQSSS
jgi:predicted metal-dependent enzyme (double-stranded beta helix superfamily)